MFLLSNNIYNTNSTKRMRNITVKIEIEDSDFVEQKLFDTLQSVLGQSMKDFIKHTDTTELYKNDEVFRNLCKKIKTAVKVKEDYINKRLID